MDVRRRVTEARVARLATADGSGAPHLVPVVFALAGAASHTCVDAKPETTRAYVLVDTEDLRSIIRAAACAGAIVTGMRFDLVVGG